MVPWLHGMGIWHAQWTMLSIDLCGGGLLGCAVQDIGAAFLLRSSIG